MTYDPIDTSATDNAADGSVTTDTLDSTTANNSGTLTTQDIVVNGTATGPFGGGGVVLESGDNLDVAIIQTDTTPESFVNLYSGSAKDVLGGVLLGFARNDWLYEFSDNTTITKNGGSGATTYNRTSLSQYADSANERTEGTFLPPAKNVIRIEVGSDLSSGAALGAEVILKS